MGESASCAKWRNRKLREERNGFRGDATFAAAPLDEIYDHGTCADIFFGAKGMFSWCRPQLTATRRISCEISEATCGTFKFGGAAAPHENFRCEILKFQIWVEKFIF